MTNSGEIAKDFGLRNQIRRAALSVMTNIAEEFGRMSDKECIRYLEVSSASSNEVRSISYAALDLAYWTADETNHLHKSTDAIRAMNRSLIKYLMTRRKH